MHLVRTRDYRARPLRAVPFRPATGGGTRKPGRSGIYLAAWLGKRRVLDFGELSRAARRG
jgi:hypothetical protein